MWNLIMNIPDREIDLQEPFFDNAGAQGDLLVNGKVPYTNDDLSAATGRFLSGQTPFEASSMYNDELKDLVRSCLRYSPAERPTVLELKALIETHRKNGVEQRARTRTLLKLIMPEMKDRFEVGVELVESGDGSGSNDEESSEENSDDDREES
jgi:serine/threonine protein kinase